MFIEYGYHPDEDWQLLIPFAVIGVLVLIEWIKVLIHNHRSK